MRRTILSLLAAGSAAAQSLSTVYATSTGLAGNMFDVVAAQSARLDSFDIDVDAGTWTVEVFRVSAGGSFVGHESNPAAWTLLGSAMVTSNGQNVPTPLPIVLDTPLLAGQTLGFYVTVTGPNVMNSAGGPTLGAIAAQNADLQILVGKTVQYPFGLSFPPRVWNGTIHYTQAGAGTFGTVATVGQGCYWQHASFYEQWPIASFDLGPRTIAWQPNGSGYTVVDYGSGAFVPPSPAAIQVAPGQLDGQQAMPLSSPLAYPGGFTSTLNVCTKGYIGADVGNPIDWSPSGPELLAFPRTTWACWHDYDQTAPGSGQILFEEVAGVAYATWNGVMSFNSPGASSTFQFQFDLATGMVRLVLGPMALAALPSWIVVGSSPGGPSVDPGNQDLSARLAAGGFVLAAADQPPLAVAASTRPITGSTWTLAVGNVPPLGVLGVTIFGATDPGFDDLAAIGLPGCGLRATLDLVGTFAVAGPSYGYGLVLPNLPTLVGLDVHTTAAVFVNPHPNPFGALTANAIRGRIGDL